MSVLLFGDIILATTLQAAAARRGLTVTLADPLDAVTAAPGDEPRLIIRQTPIGLQATGQQATGQQDAATTIFPLPLRLGALLDWIEQQQRQVPPIDLGIAGQLEPMARRIVRASHEPLLLTEKEVAIIATLARSATPAAPLSRDALLINVWGYNPEADTHTLETHIYRLRQKLDGAGISALLLTGEGGYYLAHT